MNAKEAKVALTDDTVKAIVDKQIAAAIKAETKRIVAAIKGVPLPDTDAVTAKALKTHTKALLGALKQTE